MTGKDWLRTLSLKERLKRSRIYAKIDPYPVGWRILMILTFAGTLAVMIFFFVAHLLGRLHSALGAMIPCLIWMMLNMVHMIAVVAPRNKRFDCWLEKEYYPTVQKNAKP